MPFNPRAFLKKLTFSQEAAPSLSNLKPANVTEIGKTYKGLLSYVPNGQAVSQFYVDFKGPIIAGAGGSSILILVIQVLVKIYGRKIVEDWLTALLPYITGGSFVIIGNIITYLQKGAFVWKIGTTIYNCGAAVVNIYHGGLDKSFILVDIILVGEYVPSNPYLKYKGNATQDFIDALSNVNKK